MAYGGTPWDAHDSSFLAPQAQTASDDKTARCASFRLHLVRSKAWAHTACLPKLFQVALASSPPPPLPPCAAQLPSLQCLNANKTDTHATKLNCNKQENKQTNKHTCTHTYICLCTSIQTLRVQKRVHVKSPKTRSPKLAQCKARAGALSAEPATFRADEAAPRCSTCEFTAGCGGSRKSEARNIDPQIAGSPFSQDPKKVPPIS